MTPMNVHPDQFRGEVKHLRELCGQYPALFLASHCDVGHATVNRFVNGRDVQLSTFIKLYELMYDYNNTLEDRFLDWRGEV